MLKSDFDTIYCEKLASTSSMKVKDNGKPARISTNAPSSKRLKLETSQGPNNSAIKEALKNMYEAISSRLNEIDNKINAVFSRCQYIDQKIDATTKCLGSTCKLMPRITSDGDNVTCIRDRNSNVPLDLLESVSEGQTFKSPSKLELNSESDFPKGSWLGNENDVEHRVRCGISPLDLSVLERSCHTPEKLALALLDLLFDRETQACSNISGHGKHGKKQLNPLSIYGIRCHLISRYNITDEDWHKIKLNIDSKCRSAFRRKLKGMSLVPKSFKRTEDPVESPVDISNEEQYENVENISQLNPADHPNFSKCDEEVATIHKENADGTFLTFEENSTLIELTENQIIALELGFEIEFDPQIIHTDQGNIQVLHATSEQIAEIQKSGKYQILTSSEVIQEVQDAQLTSQSAPECIMIEKQPEAKF